MGSEPAAVRLRRAAAPRARADPPPPRGWGARAAEGAAARAGGAVRMGRCDQERAGGWRARMLARAWGAVRVRVLLARA